MLNEILYALYMTMELWIFLAILGIALFVEEGVLAYGRRKTVDNPALR
jgi:hypothetical protein